jgi:hypothetical protein
MRMRRRTDKVRGLPAISLYSVETILEEDDEEEEEQK